MFIIVFAFLPLSIVNWKIVCRKESYGSRENAPHTQRKKGTIYCVMREDSGTAAVGILAAIAAIGFIINVCSTIYIEKTSFESSPFLYLEKPIVKIA